jgi:4-amino-4-deoxy-L-arabinose transferase-like glycosyltransferase
MMAEGLILATGKPVMAVGGFSGSDPILTVGELQKMVENGVVKYYMVMGGPDLSRVSYPGNHSSGNMSAFRNMAGGMFGMGSQGQISDWVEAHGTLVPSSEWLGENADNRSNSAGQGFGMGAYELYDLDGSG